MSKDYLKKYFTKQMMFYLSLDGMYVTLSNGNKNIYLKKNRSKLLVQYNHGTEYWWPLKDLKVAKHNITA